MPAQNILSSIDRKGAQLISDATGVVPRFNPLSWVIDKLHQPPADTHKQHTAHIPTLMGLAKEGGELWYGYHKGVFTYSASWAEGAKERVNAWTARVLSALSFCRMGKALQHLISHDILGETAKNIAFVALQIFFHTIPYTLASAVITGSVMLYHTNPYMLTSILVGSMLTVQIWFIYRLVKTVEVAQESFEQKADEFIEAINLVQIFKNTVYSGLEHTKKLALWTVSRVLPSYNSPSPQPTPSQ